MVVTDWFYRRGCYALILLLAFGCSDNQQTVAAKSEPLAALEMPLLDVFKSPTCGCCAKWIDHIEGDGFKTETHHPADLNGLKQKLGIAAQFQSCHTAVSKAGYIFEGHIPAEVMQRFLAEKPKGALGLSVPGMPLGSPGMEMADRRDNYDVLLLMKDGTASVYQRIR